MKEKIALHKGAVCISPDMPVTEIARAMAEQDIGAIPVGENGSLIGMVTDRDIVCRAIAKGGDFSSMTARDVMTKILSNLPQVSDRRRESGAFPSTTKERQWWAL